MQWEFGDRLGATDTHKPSRSRRNTRLAQAKQLGRGQTTPTGRPSLIHRTRMSARDETCGHDENLHREVALVTPTTYTPWIPSENQSGARRTRRSDVRERAREASVGGMHETDGVEGTLAQQSAQEVGTPTSFIGVMLIQLTIFQAQIQ